MSKLNEINVSTASPADVAKMLGIENAKAGQASIQDNKDIYHDSPSNHPLNSNRTKSN